MKLSEMLFAWAYLSSGTCFLSANAGEGSAADEKELASFFRVYLFVSLSVHLSLSPSHLLSLSRSSFLSNGCQVRFFSPLFAFWLPLRSIQQSNARKQEPCSLFFKKKIQFPSSLDHMADGIGVQISPLPLLTYSVASYFN